MYDYFTKKLKSLLSLAGYSPHLYSGHSMRRGGSTLLFQLGCDPLLIQALGDWSTDQFMKYCGLSLDQRFNAQLLMSSVVLWLGISIGVYILKIYYPHSLFCFIFYFFHFSCAFHLDLPVFNWFLTIFLGLRSTLHAQPGLYILIAKASQFGLAEIIFPYLNPLQFSKTLNLNKGWCKKNFFH